MTDHDRRRISSNVRRHDAVEPILVEAHVATLHVAPVAGAADVDPPVERAHHAPPRVWNRTGAPPHVRKRWIGARRARGWCAAPRAGWWMGDGAFRAFMARTMPRAGSPVHRTMVRGVSGPLRLPYPSPITRLCTDWRDWNSAECKELRALEPAAISSWTRPRQPRPIVVPLVQRLPNAGWLRLRTSIFLRTRK